MRKSFLSALTATCLSTVAASAQAQIGLEPAPPPPAPMDTSHAGGGGGRGLGIGVASMLTRTGGPSVAYDMGAWHLDAMLALADAPAPVKADFSIGARFFYHLASASAADFSIGGGIGYEHDGGSSNNTNSSKDVVSIEAGMQIRAFIVPNVALSIFGGLAVLAADGEGVSFGRQLLSSAGLHYFF